MTRVILKGGSIIDGIGDTPIDGYSILIEGKKIRSIEKNMEDLGACASAREIDVGGKTIMLGLIDCHVHLYFNGDSDPKMSFLSPLSIWAIKAACNAKKYIDAGFTTIRDLGSPEYIGVSVRNCIDSGIIAGPRILASGRPLGMTGGHGQSLPPWVEYREELSELVDGETEIRKAIRKQVAAGVDWIKIMATGGMSDPVSIPDIQEFSDEEIGVILNESMRAGKPVAAHAEGGDGIKAVIRAGVRSIEHGIMLDDVAIKEMMEKGIFLVPTLSAPYRIREKGLDAGISEYVVEKNEKFVGFHEISFKKALDSGVKIVMGTDAGTPFNFHGENAYELELMIRYGMEPIEALRSATKNAAELLMINTGSIEVGKLADIIVVSGDPLEDITVLQNDIDLVIKEGEIIC